MPFPAALNAIYPPATAGGYGALPPVTSPAYGGGTPSLYGMGDPSVMSGLPMMGGAGGGMQMNLLPILMALMGQGQGQSGAGAAVSPMGMGGSPQYNPMQYMQFGGGLPQYNPMQYQQAGGGGPALGPPTYVGGGGLPMPPQMQGGPAGWGGFMGALPSNFWDPNAQMFTSQGQLPQPYTGVMPLPPETQGQLPIPQGGVPGVPGPLPKSTAMTPRPADIMDVVRGLMGGQDGRMQGPMAFQSQFGGEPRMKWEEGRLGER